RAVPANDDPLDTGQRQALHLSLGGSEVLPSSRKNTTNETTAGASQTLPTTFCVAGRTLYLGIILDRRIPGFVRVTYSVNSSALFRNPVPSYPPATSTRPVDSSIATMSDLGVDMSATRRHCPVEGA